MKTRSKAPKTINQYIARYPKDVQGIMQKIRMTIRKAAPRAEETISYAIPSFYLNGKGLISFAAWKKHVAMYAAPMGIPQFKRAVAVYGAGKGTLRFPLDKPIPYGLITKLVKFRVRESSARAAANVRKK